MADFDTTGLVEALKETEAFTDEQIKLLEGAGEDLQMWSLEEYMELGLTRSDAIVARMTLRDSFGVVPLNDVAIPDSPTYLKHKGRPPQIGKPLDDGTITHKRPADVGDYNPHDPMQFMKVGDQKFRFDGKRSERFPEGEIHEIAIITHRIQQDGVLMPDFQEAAEAMTEGKQWFHRHYNCWISTAGKPLSPVARDKIIEMRGAVVRTTARVA